MGFAERVLEKQVQIHEEKKKRFSTGNRAKAKTKDILTTIEALDSEFIVDAIEKSGLTPYTEATK